MSSNPRVIIADDTQSNSDVFCEFLLLNNIEVVGIGRNGLEAVQLFEKHSPDVALVDLAMPSYDGYFALKNMLAINNNAKVIIVTALQDKKNKKKLLEMGALRVLHKPFELNKIVKIINTIYQEKNILSV
ncbi:MAG: response regulator [Candidatus Nitrosopumilus sp. bin_68KS]